MNYIEPIKSNRNKFGYRGVKRNEGCRKPFVAVYAKERLGRFDTAFEAGQAYARKIFSENEAQQEFDFYFKEEEPVREETTEIIKKEFISLLKKNEEVAFQTAELVDEIFNLRPSERKELLKNTNRISFRGASYSYSGLDALFKKWAMKNVGIKFHKSKGTNYYVWQETREEKALQIIQDEYGEFSSQASSFEDLQDHVQVYFSSNDFGFKVSLEENTIIGFKIGSKFSRNWEGK